MNECGVYRVVGSRAFPKYRGHDSGTEFIARLEPGAERRAIARGSIERIGTVIPRPENYVFPDGWLPSHVPTTEARESGSLH